MREWDGRKMSRKAGARNPYGMSRPLVLLDGTSKSMERLEKH
jgi:hypothetical protein